MRHNVISDFTSQCTKWSFAFFILNHNDEFYFTGPARHSHTQTLVVANNWDTTHLELHGGNSHLFEEPFIIGVPTVG